MIRTINTMPFISIVLLIVIKLISINFFDMFYIFIRSLCESVFSFNIAIFTIAE